MNNTKRKTRYMAGAVLGTVYMLVAADPAAGATITVNAGADLQAAINKALPGDTLLLAAGATFVGNFVLPVKSGATARSFGKVGKPTPWRPMATPWPKVEKLNGGSSRPARSARMRSAA